MPKSSFRRRKRGVDDPAVDGGVELMPVKFDGHARSGVRSPREVNVVAGRSRPVDHLPDTVGIPVGDVGGEAVLNPFCLRKVGGTLKNVGGRRLAGLNVRFDGFRVGVVPDDAVDLVLGEEVVAGLPETFLHRSI